MSKIEYLSIEGLRIDGRRINEVRDITLSCSMESDYNNIKYDGISYITHGLNKVLVYVRGPEECQKNKNLNDESVDIQCEILLSAEKKVKNIQHDRMVTDLSKSIKTTFNQVIIAHLYKRSSINVFINIIESDGGIKSTVLNAVCIALIDAGIAMKDLISSCTAVYLDSHILIDGNYMECNASSIELVLAVAESTKKIIYLELKSKVPVSNLYDLVETCIMGTEKFSRIAKDKLRNYAYKILKLNEKIHRV